MLPIPMVDLQTQYRAHQQEIDASIALCLSEGNFIGGKKITEFENKLAAYLGIDNCISCANGTDALQIALMALDLPKGSKIIVPAFTYIATAEVVKLLGFELVLCDVDVNTFNVNIEHIKAVYSEDVKAIIVVHLFGQVCDINEITAFCKDNNIFLIEDNAQALGAEKNIQRNSIITTSFYPTKNLGAYGDGGALFCNDVMLANKIRKIANHGQTQKYVHEIVGINSRLDVIQAAILQVKLAHLDAYNARRKAIAEIYHQKLKEIQQIELPIEKNTHIFHQYTIKVKNNLRDELKKFLAEKNIQTAIHYPIPIYKQQAFLDENLCLPNTEFLCSSVLSIPIFPELTDEQIMYICACVISFFSAYE